MHHLHGGVHVAQGERDQRTRHPLVGVGKRIGVRPGEAACGLTLERNLVLVGRIDDALEQVVLDCRTVSHARAFPRGGVALLNLVEHWRVGAVGHVGDNRHVGLQALGDHLGAPQANFFLHRVGDVQPKRQLHLVFVQHARHFGNHEATGAVVEGTSHVPIFVEDHELVGVGHHATHVDAHFLHLFLVFRSDVQKDVLQRGCFFFSGRAGVDGRPAKQAGHDAVLGVDVHALRRGDLVVASAVTTQVDESVARDVVHKPADLVGVRFDDHFVGCVWVDDPHDRAVCVDDMGVDVRLDVVEPQLLAFGFKAGGRRVVQVSLQKLLGLRRDDFLLCHVPKLPRGSTAQCSTPPAVVHRGR